MIKSFFLAIGQLSDPAFLKVFIKSVLVTLVLFIILGIGIVWAWSYLPPTGWEWLDIALQYTVVPVLIILPYFLFPGLATMVMGIFLDDVALAVERRHYPEDDPGDEPPLSRAVGAAARLTAAMIVLNLIFLPVYLVLLFSVAASILIPVVFGLVNAWLVGREYFEVAALRFESYNKAKENRHKYPRQIFWSGAIIAAMFAVPLVNLLAPVIGTAFMVHVYKTLPPRHSFAGPTDTL